MGGGAKSKPTPHLWQIILLIYLLYIIYVVGCCWELCFTRYDRVLNYFTILVNIIGSLPDFFLSDPHNILTILGGIFNFSKSSILGTMRASFCLKKFISLNKSINGKKDDSTGHSDDTQSL